VRGTAGLPFPAYPEIPGFDVAGVVVASFDADPALSPGARVAGMAPAGRCLAEYVAVPGGCLAPIPLGVTFERAAAVPLAALTALQVLGRLGVLAPDGRPAAAAAAAPASVLLHGGVGGTGSLAVQLAAAVARVPRIVVSVSAGKAALARRLGATETVPRGDAAAVAAAVVASAGWRVEAAGDLVGDAVPGLLPALATGGGRTPLLDESLNLRQPGRLTLEKGELW